MRGSPAHNLIAQLMRSDFLARGAQVSLEHRVDLGWALGFVDLLVLMPCGLRIVVEVELTDGRRVQGDMMKARALRADLLLIPTPTARVARSCHRVILRNASAFSGEVLAQPAGPLRAALARRFSVV